MPGTQQSQFDGENAVSGYTLFHGKDGKSYYLKGENLADGDITQRVQKLRGAQPADTGTDVADLQRRTLQQSRTAAAKPLTNALDVYKPMPGSTEGPGLLHGLADWDRASFGEIGGGAGDIARGDVSRGAHRIIGGASTATLPALPFMAAAAPALTARAALGGTVGSYVGEKGGELAGLSPDQSAVAGDIGGLAGGIFGTKTPQLRSAASNLLRTPEGPFKPPVASVIDAAKHPTEIFGRGAGALLDWAVPERPQYPGATLPAAEDFYSNRGADLMRRGAQEDILARRATATAKANAPQPELGSPENPGFHAKLPTRMPKPTAPAPIKTSPFGNATPSNALNADIPLPQAGAYSPPSANVPGLTRSPYAPPEASAPTVEPSRASVVRLPEPREPLPGENPNYNASIPRARLLDLGRQGRPGAGDQLRNIGKTVLYVPPEGYPGPRSAYDPPDAQYSRAGGTEGPYAPPDYAYRAHDAGNYDIDLASHAHATESAAEAQTYAQSRNAGTPQQVSKINLGKVGPQGYEVREGPNGKKWYKFKRPLTQEDYEQ